MPLLRPGERLGIVTEVISPYRIPVFNAVNRLLDGQLRVFFLSQMAGRRWPVYSSEIEFSYEVLRGTTKQPFGPATQPLYLNIPVFARLRHADIGPVVVGGYNHLEFLWSLLYTRIRKRPLVLWSESVSAVAGGRPLRTHVKRAIVSACDAYLVPGQRAADQLRYLGAPEPLILEAPNSVDTEFWSAAAAPRKNKRGSLRLIAVGSLIRRKGLDLLLAALDRDELRHLPLEIVGEGPEERALRDEATRRNLNVSFLGHLDREELRERYRKADVFVFPSRSDPWGLVLNESMAAGCVPIASTAAGATTDMVLDGKTGLVVDSDDVAGLQAALLRLSSDRKLLSQLSANALVHACEATAERCAEGFTNALRAVG